MIIVIAIAISLHDHMLSLCRYMAKPTVHVINTHGILTNVSPTFPPTFPRTFPPTKHQTLARNRIRSRPCLDPIGWVPPIQVPEKLHPF